jgi:hypothetical protein
MTISEELKELYASSGTDVILHTLTFIHSSWAAPLYLVSDFQDLTANLEDSGIEVTFSKFAFEVTGPSSDGKGSRRLGITLDNVSREVMVLLNQAVTAQTQVPIEVIYRIYISSDLTGPQNNPPLRLWLKDISCTNQRITGTAEVVGLINRKFPSINYGFQFKSLLDNI